MRWAIHYTTVVKSKINSSKSVSYRFYSLHSSIMYSLFNDIHVEHNLDQSRLYSFKCIFFFIIYETKGQFLPFLAHHNTLSSKYLKRSISHWSKVLDWTIWYFSPINPLISFCKPIFLTQRFLTLLLQKRYPPFKSKKTQSNAKQIKYKKLQIFAPPPKKKKNLSYLVIKLVNILVFKII